MALSKSTLESLLRIRRLKRDQAAKARQQTQLKLEHLFRQIENLVASSANQRTSGRVIKALELHELENFQTSVSWQLTKLQSEVQAFEKELDRQETAFASAHQELRIAERLIEKQRDSAYARKQKIEQQEIDEATLRQLRAVR